jgi:hypothetical protein
MVLMSDSDINLPDDTNRRETPARHDPTAALRAVIQLTLRTDLRRILAGCPIEQSGLRENLRTIGAHARRHELHVEQLLVLIKDACAALPEGRELLAQPDRAETVNRLISMAVEEYYGPVAPPI